MYFYWDNIFIDENGLSYNGLFFVNYFVVLQKNRRKNEEKSKIARQIKLKKESQTLRLLVDGSTDEL